MDSSPLSLIKEGITFLTFSYLVIIIILFFFPPQTTTNNLPTNVSFRLLKHKIRFRSPPSRIRVVLLLGEEFGVRKKQ